MSGRRLSLCFRLEEKLGKGAPSTNHVRMLYIIIFPLNSAVHWPPESDLWSLARYQQLATLLALKPFMVAVTEILLPPNQSKQKLSLKLDGHTFGLKSRLRNRKVDIYKTKAIWLIYELTCKVSPTPLLESAIFIHINIYILLSYHLDKDDKYERSDGQFNRMLVSKHQGFCWWSRGLCTWR